MKPNNSIISDPLVAYDPYYERFRRHVFTLLFIGYTHARNKNLDLAVAEEDDITDHIVKGIEEYKKDLYSPAWVENYAIEQQRPHSSHGEIGDRRKWLDIFFQGNRREQNNTFCFEAKRLYPGQKPKRYFGQKGMQQFLLREYPTNPKGEAVMLGYVQSHDIQYWLQWLKTHFENFRADLHISTDSSWDDFPIIPQLPYSFRTQHVPLSDIPVVLFHVLLSFVGDGSTVR